MLLIARALVLLIHGGLFDSRLCTFFLVLLGCYSLSLLFQIEGSDDYTLFCFDLQVEMNESACNASSWDFDMTFDSPRSKSIDNNRQELRQPPCAASPRRYLDNEHRHHQAFNPSAANHGAYSQRQHHQAFVDPSAAYPGAYSVNEHRQLNPCAPVLHLLLSSHPTSTQDARMTNTTTAFTSPDPAANISQTVPPATNSRGRSYRCWWDIQYSTTTAVAVSLCRVI